MINVFYTNVSLVTAVPLIFYSLINDIFRLEEKERRRKERKEAERNEIKNREEDERKKSVCD